LNGIVKGAVSKAIQAFATFPGALAIARNGGSELTLRSATLGFLEQAGFVTFTEELSRYSCAVENRSEEGGVASVPATRHDIVLRCPCNKPLAVVELKHNLAHRQQLGFVRAERDGVKARLLPLSSGTEYPVYYYTHFVFGLECEDRSWLAALHNSIMGDTYKAFQSREALAAAWNAVSDALGVDLTFGPLPVNSPADVHARAELRCWIFQVCDGQMTVLPNN